MEGPDAQQHPDSNTASTADTESCFGKSCSALTVDDVYEIAKLIGAEVEKLIDGYGKDSVVGLVPKIVKVLELLESFASRSHVHKLKEEELLKTFETLQLQQQRKQQQRSGGVGREGEEGNEKNEIRVSELLIHFDLFVNNNMPTVPFPDCVCVITTMQQQGRV